MLSEPHWLLFIVPLIILVFIFKPESKILLSLRVMLIIIICLALTGPVMKIKGQEGIVVVVADRSSSMPDEIDKRIQETVSILRDQKPTNSKIALVSFTDKARVEFNPTNNDFSSLSLKQNPDSSNLAEGIEYALSMIPEGVSGRLLVISDGLWNGNDPQNVALNAVSRNIPIDYRFISRELVNDLAISYFKSPSYLEPNELFILRAGVVSPLEQDATIELFNNDKLLLKSKYHLLAGLNELSFNMMSPADSLAKYIFKVTSLNNDPQLNNNTAQCVSMVKGKKPVLAISDNKISSLRNIFENKKISFIEKTPKEFSWRLEDLSGFSCVILENISADDIGYNGMHTLSAWIKYMGGGLLITGGKNSYGNGGYYQSPLEETLPITLELRSDCRKMSIAIAVVLDRSGSMGMQVNGRTKMELADLAAVSSLDLLMPSDEFGVFAVDTSPHLIVPLHDVKTKNEWRNDILSIRSEGGGIYVYEGIEAAVKMLLNAKSKTRHIILFSDTCDSEKPGTYWELLDKAAKEGITLSVIGLGKETDCDGELLKKIANSGGGRCFFTDIPEDLPRLFSQDTFIAAKSSFVDEKTNIYSSYGLNTYIGSNINIKSSIDGFNICYLKPDGAQIITADNEDKSPVLAAWQYGIGRVACYTGVLSEEFGGNFFKSDYASQVFSGLCDWVAFDDRNALGEIVISQKLVNGKWKAYLNLDPERVKEPFSVTPTFDIVSSVNGHLPVLHSLKASWENADQLSVSYNLLGNEVISPLLRINNKQNIRLSPTCMMYSPEFLPQEKRNGAVELKNLAKMTGGNELIDLNSVWASMPALYQDKDISNYLFAIALFLFLLEISERRMAVITILLSKMKSFRNKDSNLAVERKEIFDVSDDGKILSEMKKNILLETVTKKDDVADKYVKFESSFANDFQTVKKIAKRRNR